MMTATIGCHRKGIDFHGLDIKDKRTAKFASGDRVKEFQGFERQVYKRLVQAG